VPLITVSRLLNVVRDAAGELSHTLHLLCLTELGVEHKRSVISGESHHRASQVDHVRKWGYSHTRTGKLVPSFRQNTSLDTPMHLSVPIGGID